MYQTYLKAKHTVYQLIASPAVLKNENDTYNTVYSILSVQVEGGATTARIVYDITRIRSVGEKILSEVTKHSPPQNSIHEFIADLL